MTARFAYVAASLLVAGCADRSTSITDAATDAAPPLSDVAASAPDVSATIPADADTTSVPQLFSHTAGPFAVGAGDEIPSVCESWTLNNSTTLYVNAVSLHAGAGMHHSNWFFVPDRTYPGPDGHWVCPTRGFDEGAAAFVGGVLFAQSTQSTEQTQQFAPGAVIPIPPHSRIVGQLHILNTTTEAIQVPLALDIHTIPAAQVTQRLAGLYLEYGPLVLPAHARSRFSTGCDYNTVHEGIFHRPIDFKLWYGLPHYHSMGQRMRVTVMGGPHDGETVFDENTRLGEASGRQYAPPFDLAGATGLSLACDFENTTDRVMHYGLGSGEMCIFLAFTDSTYQWVGRAPIDGNNTVGTTDDAGVVQNTSPCTQVVGLPGHDLTN